MTDAVEEALYRHRQPLLGELSVAFFDTTSLYFEGRGGATLGQRGFSKDYPAATAPSGARHRARRHTTGRSPRSSGPATPPMSPRCCRSSSVCATRFGIARACVVADRGMISAATIAGLETQGIDYILGVRERSTAEVRTTVID